MLDVDLRSKVLALAFDVHPSILMTAATQDRNSIDSRWDSPLHIPPPPSPSPPASITRSRHPMADSSAAGL